MQEAMERWLADLEHGRDAAVLGQHELVVPAPVGPAVHRGLIVGPAQARASARPAPPHLDMARP